MLNNNNACYFIAAFMNEEGTIDEILINNDDAELIQSVSERIAKPVSLAISSMFGAKKRQLVAYHSVYTDRGMDLTELVHYQEDVRLAIACTRAV